MTQVALSSTPVRIQQGPATGWTLQNLGPGNVYLYTDTSVSPATGYLVQPGVALPLTDNAELWAMTDTSATIATSSGISGSNATIITGNVTATLSGPVTFAPGSNVAVNGGTLTGIANVVSVQGIVQTEATNFGVQLSRTVIPLATSAGLHNASFTLPAASQYSSFCISIVGSQPGTGTFSPSSLSDTWNMSFAATQGTNGQNVWGYSLPNAFCTVFIPVLANTAINGNIAMYNTAAIAAGQTVTITIYGMYGNYAPQASFKAQGSFGTPVQLPNSTAFSPSSSAQDFLLNHDSRDLQVMASLLNGAFTASFHVYIFNTQDVTVGSSQILAALGANSAPQFTTQNQSFNPGMSQCTLRVFNSGSNAQPLQVAVTNMGAPLASTVQ